jgi:hypothetical protein
MCYRSHSICAEQPQIICDFTRLFRDLQASHTFIHRGVRPWSQSVQAAVQSHVQAVCNEGDQNVSFDAILELMKDGRMARSPLRLRRGSPSEWDGDRAGNCRLDFGVHRSRATRSCRHLPRPSEGHPSRPCQCAPSRGRRSSQAWVSASPIPDEAPITLAFFDMAFAAIQLTDQTIPRHHSTSFYRYTYRHISGRLRSSSTLSRVGRS